MSTTHVELAPGVNAYHRNGLAVVLLASQHCFFVQLQQRVPRREWGELKYELEAHVPLDAEAMSSIVLDTEPTAALVCNADYLAGKIDVVQELTGVEVLAVVPHSLLIGENYFPARKHRTILIASDTVVDCLVVSGGQLHSWTWHQGTELPQLLDNKPVPGRDVGDVIVVSADSEADSLTSGFAPKCEVASYDDQAVQTAVERILRGDQDPRFSFENGPLSHVDRNAPARKIQLLSAWATAAAISLVVGAVFLRASTLRNEATQAIAQQQGIFEQTFPGQRLPVGLMSRFESERRRLAATRDQSQVPQVGSALPVMHAFLSGIDTEARFSTSMLHFVPGQLVKFDCVAKSYADLEQLQSSLVERGFAMPQTSAKQTSRGVRPRWDAIKWLSGSRGERAEQANAE